MDGDTTPSNLPVRVVNIGGAVAEVLGWRGHQLVLTKKQMYRISDVVATMPELNNTEDVDRLAELAGRYKQIMNAEFDDLVKHYGLERVYLAVVTLYDVGLRSTDESGSPAEAMTQLEEMLEFLANVEKAGYVVDDPENTEEYIRKLGTWDVAKKLTAPVIAGILDAAVRGVRPPLRDTLGYDGTDGSGDAE